MAEPVLKRMEFGRLICDTEIPVLQHKTGIFSSSYRKSLESLRARAQETAQYQGWGFLLVCFHLTELLLLTILSIDFGLWLSVNQGFEFLHVFHDSIFYGAIYALEVSFMVRTVGFDLSYVFPAKLEDTKAKLREAEDDLVKALGVKTRKEAKRMALMDAIASVKTRVEDLKSSVQKQITKNTEYAAILSQYSPASEGTMNGSNEQEDEILEAISWYNTVLGFHVEGGRGVKFTFKNIDMSNPNVECFFTIRHENDMYTLLNCEPSLKGMEELIYELNKTNGLFKYVRVMRMKFKEAVAQGSVASLNFEHQESATISTCAPDLSISSLRSDSPSKKNENQFQATKGERPSKKQILGRQAISAALSPGSASSVRQSPRLRV